MPSSGKANFNLNESYITAPSGAQQAEIDSYNKTSTFHEQDRAQQEITTMPIFNSTLKDTQLNTQADLVESTFTDFDPNANQNVEISLLTGLPLEKAHANMVPFYGSTIKQNMEAFSNVGLLDRFTGNTDTFKHKEESAPMFQRVQQDIMGTPAVMNNLDKDRFNISNYRENERPFEPTRISAIKEGSFDLPRAREKTIDELRSGNKPQISYAGRTVDNQKSSVRGIMGKFSKNSIDRSFEQSQDMLLKGKSQYLQKQNYQDNNYDNLTNTNRGDLSAELFGNPSNTSRGIRQGVVLANRDA